MWLLASGHTLGGKGTSGPVAKGLLCRSRRVLCRHDYSFQNEFSLILSLLTELLLPTDSVTMASES